MKKISCDKWHVKSKSTANWGGGVRGQRPRWGITAVEWESWGESFGTCGNVCVLTRVAGIMGT